MDDNDNSTDGYGGSCDGGYGDSDTDMDETFSSESYTETSGGMME